MKRKKNLIRSWSS